MNIVLLWQVLRSLKIRGAWLIALIFAVHPLCVTSVTWIAERKNVLSMFYYLLSLWLYLRSENAPCAEEEKVGQTFLSAGSGDFPVASPGQTGKSGNRQTGMSALHSRSFRVPSQAIYIISIAAYVLALLSKTSAVVLPVILLLCVWWREGNISRPAIRRVLPFFAVAFAAGLTTVIAHYFFGPKDSVTDSLLVRLLAGSRAVWFYVGKAFAPVHLTMNYARWEMAASSTVSYLPALAILGAFGVFWFFRKSWGRSCLFGFGYFVIALAPTLGVFKMTFLKFSQVADHFQFLALPGVIAFVVGGVCYFTEASPRTLRYGVHGFFLLLAVPLAMASVQRQTIVGDSERLWRDNLAKNPQSWLAHKSVADAAMARRDLPDAENHYRQALELRPDYLDALSNLGVLLGGLNRWEEAIACYERALAFNPGVAAVHFNLGIALFSQNRFADAVKPLSKAVHLAPENSSYHNNLASALIRTGKSEEAVPHLHEALRLNPSNPEAHANLGSVLFRQGKKVEALDHYERAATLAEAVGQIQAAKQFRDFLRSQNRAVK
jgi:tetratricopeptide (TPR) repeat protein